MNRSSDEGFIERELAAAMNDYVDSTPVPSYDAGRLTAARRRVPPVWALAAVVAAVAAIGTGVALLPGSGGDRVAAPMSASPSTVVVKPTTAPTPTLSPSPVQTGKDGGPLDENARMDREIRTVVTAAEMYRNPATRSQVDLAAVAAQFVSPAVFHQVWGSDGLGATCGAVADGAIADNALEAQFFNGARVLPRHALFGYDPTTALISGVSCSAAPKRNADKILADVYGGQVSGGKSGDGLLGPKVTTVTCGADTAKTWFADNPGSGTLTWGWDLRLDAGRPLQVGRSNSGLVDSVTCPK